jgi:FkbM family methyltransferase
VQIIGLYSLDFKLRLPQLEVHAFEPEHIAYECLKKSATSLNLKNFHLNNLGLGENEQDLVFYKDIKNSGGHSFLPGRTRKARSEIKIHVSTLDDYVEKQNLEKIDVIKIDVEGFEIFVFKGALKTIAKHKPIILFEQIYSDDENVVSILSDNLNDNFTLSCLRTMEEITPLEFKDYCHKMAFNGIKGDDYLIKFL